MSRCVCVCVCVCVLDVIQPEEKNKPKLGESIYWTFYTALVARSPLYIVISIYTYCTLNVPLTVW